MVALFPELRLHVLDIQQEQQRSYAEAKKKDNCRESGREGREGREGGKGRAFHRAITSAILHAGEGDPNAPLKKGKSRVRMLLPANRIAVARSSSDRALFASAMGEVEAVDTHMAPSQFEPPGSDQSCGKTRDLEACHPVDMDLALPEDSGPGCVEDRGASSHTGTHSHRESRRGGGARVHPDPGLAPEDAAAQCSADAQGQSS